MTVALLCNPQAGGRWRVLSDVLDSDEAKGVHRIVTDDIVDVSDAIAGLGKRVDLLCIYGGDGTIFRVVNELLRSAASPPPRLAFLGGGTMNVTAAWCGMRRSPGENFRRVMRAYNDGDELLWREIPVLAVRQGGTTQYGFTFGLGPLTRILERFEAGEKSHFKAIEIALKSIAAAVSGVPRNFQSVLRETDAAITIDGEPVPFERFSAIFANVTGVINPFIAPFVDKRTHDCFNFLAYAVSSREFALMAPLLARGRVPGDARYLNRSVKEMSVKTDDPSYTIDGELLLAQDSRFDVALGPVLQLATLG